MNESWKKFLLAENASFENYPQISFPSVEPEHHGQIYPIPDLTVITVAGNDAAKFLQGQMTCDVNAVTETLSSLGAFCNAKGRVITTFLVIKNKNVFLLIMPVELLATIKKRLHMYILRADVILTDSSDEFCLIGLCHADNQSDTREQPFATSEQKNGSITINLPQNRYLVLAEPEEAIATWSNQVHNQDFKPGNSSQWRYLDIISGIPWLSTETSEEFIPQMLNLDKLGGISFNKGCYTGQEIIARTHYLGKAKREMFLAECNSLIPPEPNTAIIDERAGEEEAVGRVLQAQNQQNICKMLIVLQTSGNTAYNLKLKNHERSKIILLPL
jgi:folate-binding protein YgfZ